MIVLRPHPQAKLLGAQTQDTQITVAQGMLQQAIDVEFATLPPYLYSLYSIRPGSNAQAAQLVKSVALQEMIHFCLASNILNCIGGTPRVNPPKYPAPIGTPDDGALQLHLFPFSAAAMAQAMAIEQPVDPPAYCPLPEGFPETDPLPDCLTIGQFYDLTKTVLRQLPASAFAVNRCQITDKQFFPGQMFAVNCVDDAIRAIDEIISEGEGSSTNPVDFQDDLAHYYRFGEVYYNAILTRTIHPAEQPYQWGEPLGVDYSLAGVYPAITDPALFDFSTATPEAQLAQTACNEAFSSMVATLQNAVNGTQGALGEAVQAMFLLRLSALNAFTVPLNSSGQVAGPAFQIV